MTSEITQTGCALLSERLTNGALPLPEALRIATLLADVLRQIHDSGRVCGILQPSSVAVSGSGVELVDVPQQPGAVTPYTAPELLQGQPADARSDVFAFGAILYEMVTGRRAFDGDTPDALSVSLAIASPAPAGHTAVDHLVGNCTAKDPAVRSQRMQKVILELKVLTIAPRAESPRMPTVTAVVRAQTDKLENRVIARLQTQEKALIDVRQASGDSINELRNRLDTLEADIRPVHTRSAMVEELCASVMKHLEQVQLNVQSIDNRVTGLREQNDVLSQNLNIMQEYMHSRMHEFEQTLKAQRTALASIAASQEQTDDVVEGMVGAMELVHTIVYDREEAFQ